MNTLEWQIHEREAYILASLLSRVRPDMRLYTIYQIIKDHIKDFGGLDEYDAVILGELIHEASYYDN